jgi:hypothetical protein
VNNSPGLSSVRMTRTTRSVKERRKRTTNKEISLNSPQRGKEQRHGGSYIAKGGRRLALIPRRPPQQGCPFTLPWAREGAADVGGGEDPHQGLQHP